MLTIAHALSTTAAPMAPAEYRVLVERLREEVVRVVPPGSAVLVVSRGDPELVALPDRSGWHFPRAANGEYAGHHPADSAAAIAHLDAQRSAGAEFLVFPSTAFWWLGHYGALAEYLGDRARLVADCRDICLIFALDEAWEGAPAPKPDAVAAADPLPDAGVRHLIDALLPAGSIVVVVGHGGAAPPLPGRISWGLRVSGKTSDGGANGPASTVVVLEALRDRGAEFLLVPAEARQAVEEDASLHAHLRERLRQVTDQRHLCTIYDLRRQPVRGRGRITQSREGDSRWR